MESILKDRYTRGLVAGLLAGIIALAWNLFSHYVLHFSTLVWGDFVAALIFRRPVAATWEFVFTEVIALLFTGFLGTVFSLLIPVTRSRFLWLKGMVFGAAVWFLTFSLAIMFRIPTLTRIPSLTALVHFSSASLWGILLGVFLEIVDRRLQEDTRAGGAETRKKGRTFRLVPQPVKKIEQPEERKVRLKKPRKMV